MPSEFRREKLTCSPADQFPPGGEAAKPGHRAIGGHIAQLSILHKEWRSKVLIEQALEQVQITCPHGSHFTALRPAVQDSTGELAKIV